MNIDTEQVFIVNTTELRVDQHTPTPLQRVFAMPLDGEPIQREDEQSSGLCLPQTIGPPSRTQMCRLCATVTEMVLPIFEGEGLQNNLADKIHQHLPIQVSEDDLLPVVMCFQCTSTLLAWHELVVCSVQADSVMRERFKLSFTQQQQQPNAMSSQNQMKDEKSGHPLVVKRENETERNLYDLGDAGHGTEIHDTDDSEDRPLASLVVDREEAFLTFYDALVRFRNHVASEHAPQSPESDSSEESAGKPTSGDLGVDAYDDLSHRNRRRSKLDISTREEIANSRVRTEDGRVVFQCSTCGKHLSSAHTLIFHRRIHTGERPCVCHVCGAQFRAAPGLQRHLHETHERRRRLACRTCHRTFANAQNLKQHMRIHTGERPYECAVCGKTFAQSGSLHAHRAVHGEARPHTCAECGAAFRLRGGLARHRLRHSGERPHACGLCPRAFRARHEARAHRASHGDARPHTCALCPAAFRARRALRLHHQRTHREDAPPPPPASTHPPLSNLAPPCTSDVRCEQCTHAPPDCRLRARPCAQCRLHRARANKRPHIPTYTHKQKTPRQPTPETKQTLKFKLVPKIQRTPSKSPLAETSLVTSSLSLTLLVDDSTKDSIGRSQTDVEPQPLRKIDTKVSEENTDPPIKFSDLENEDFSPSKHESIPREQQSDQKHSKEPETASPERSNDFSDHSDTENEFGRLPESVFDAIEDSQDAHSDDGSQGVPDTEKSEAKKPNFPRSCPVCEKRCNSLSGWYYHLRHTHGARKNLTCDDCNKVFATKSEMATHARTHTKEKPFTCRTCQSVFSSRAGRYIHEQTHLDKKVHVCGRCSRAFRWRTHLRRHEARHTAAKTHVCPQCGRAFSIAFDLIRHIRAHTPGCHRCDVCDAAFKQKRYLKVHMENIHLARISTSSDTTKKSCRKIKEPVLAISDLDPALRSISPDASGSN